MVRSPFVLILVPFFSHQKSQPSDTHITCLARRVVSNVPLRRKLPPPLVRCCSFAFISQSIGILYMHWALRVPMVELSFLQNSFQFVCTGTRCCGRCQRRWTNLLDRSRTSIKHTADSEGKIRGCDARI